MADAAGIAVNTTADMLKTHPAVLEVIFVLFSPSALAVYEKQLSLARG